MKARLSRILVITGFIIYLYPAILDINIPKAIMSNFSGNGALLFIVIGFLLSNSKNKHKSR